MPPHKVATGVKVDYEELLRRFQNTRCVRFEEFAKIWREMKMTYIFCGHENENELLSFTDECLSIALSFCLQPHSFQWRAGGLYLLYAVYFKQPNTVRAKIRVTMDQWKEILSFIAEVVEQKHHDTHFIFWKLRQHNAFHFVAFPKQMAPYNKDVSNVEGSCYFLESSSLKDMLEEGYCNPLEQIHSKYLATKKELFPHDASVSVVNEDICSSIISKIEEFERKRVKTVAGYLNEREDDDEVDEMEDGDDEDYKRETDDEDQHDIGVRRSRLKKMTMSRKAKTKRSRRHRAVEMAVVSPERSSPRKVSKKSVGKKSVLTAKTGSEDEEKLEETSCQLSMPQFT